MKGLPWSSECVDWPQQVASMAALLPSSTSQRTKNPGSGGSTSFALAFADFKFDIGISAEQLRQCIQITYPTKTRQTLLSFN